jgi:hypothetical protein
MAPDLTDTRCTVTLIVALSLFCRSARKLFIFRFGIHAQLVSQVGAMREVSFYAPCRHGAP